MNATNDTRFRRFVGTAALAIAVAGLAAGCSSERMSAETTSQREEMARENAEWRSRLAQWATDHAQMKEWQASHPPAKSAEKERLALDEHAKELTDHEIKLGEFARDLETHESAILAAESELLEDRIADHPALWAEHVRLKAAFSMLESEHGDLVKEHVEFAGGLGASPPNL